MTIEARIEKDSIGPNKVRLTTFVLRYPRFIHSELLTHRVFSRNASSSRAIPVSKQLDMIMQDTAYPLEFRLNQKGMQAGAPLSEVEQAKAKELWNTSRDVAVRMAEWMSQLGVHKQYVNRLVEPFSHISVVLSATEFANFFALRHHSMAQPEIAELAKQMWDLYSTSKPQELKHGEWHLPFISEEEKEDHWSTCYNEAEAYTSFEDVWLPLIKSSVARCARVSYLTHEGKTPTYEEDMKLYDRLLAEQPIHASPAEHQARCDRDWDEGCWSGNLRGWVQYRKTLKGENITVFEGPLG